MSDQTQLSTSNVMTSNQLRRSGRRNRTVSMAVTLVSIAALVTGCGGDKDASGGGGDNGSDGNGAEGIGIECPVDGLDDADGPVDIHIWHTQIGTPKDTLEAIADQYNKSQDRVVVHMENQGTLDELTKKFGDAMVDPTSMPDIIMPDDTVTQFMADSGAIIPADACIQADPDAKAIYDDLVPVIRASFSIDGVLWPGAFNAADASLFYNKNHFEAAGLDAENPPKTLAEVREVAEALKAAKVPGMETPMVLKVNPWVIEFMISGAGEHMVDQNNGRDGLATKSLYDNDVSNEVFQWLSDMQKDGLLKIADYSQDIEPFMAMAQQTSSMLIDTSSAISTVDAAIRGTINPEDLGLDAGTDTSAIKFADLNIGVGENPGLKAAGQGQVGGTMWYIVDTTDNPRIAGAWDFMKFFNQPDIQVKWAVDGSSFPVSMTAAKDPELQKQWADTQVGRWLAIAYKSFEALDPENPGPVIGPYKEFRASVQHGLERMFFQGEDPATTVEKIDEEFQKELDDYRADVGG